MCAQSPLSRSPANRCPAHHAWLAAFASENWCNLHHRPETLTAAVGDGADLSVRSAIRGAALLGSAGRSAAGVALIAADPFLIVNGDTSRRRSHGALRGARWGRGALVHAALVPNREFDRYACPLGATVA